MKPLFTFTSIFFLSLLSLFGQELSPYWDELTSSDFSLAVEQSDGVCVVPIGVIEKHGQHLPLGSDVYAAREICRRATEQEYCIIYPYYFMGQIFEAKHQPGTIAYSSELLLRLLDETCAEISRNGIKKIIIVNGHGGNLALTQYFCQIQLATPRDYAVYAIFPSVSSDDIQQKIKEMRKTTTGGHADEVEASVMMAIRPDLVKIEEATNESGDDQEQLQDLPHVFTGIKWYSQYPNHYAGDARYATPEIGELSLEGCTQQLVEIIKAVKADETTISLQNEFFNESQLPLKTKVK